MRVMIELGNGNLTDTMTGRSRLAHSPAPVEAGVAWEIRDGCQGHPQGAGQYHFHATTEFPYAVGCYKETPISLRP